MALSLRLSFPCNWPGASIPKMETTLIFNQVGTNPSITSEWPCAHIWSCNTTSYSCIRKALIPISIIPGNWPGTSILRMEFNAYIWSCSNQSYSHIRMDQHSYLTWKEPILSPWQNGSALTSDLLIRMAMGLVVSISPHYRSKNGSLVPIWHKGGFLLFENKKKQNGKWHKQNSKIN